MTDPDWVKRARVLNVVRALPGLEDPGAAESLVLDAFDDHGPTVFERWAWPFVPASQSLREPGAYVQVMITYAWGHEGSEPPLLDVGVTLYVWNPSMGWYREDGAEHDAFGAEAAFKVAHGLLEVVCASYHLRGVGDYDPRAVVRQAPEEWSKDHG